MKVAIIGAGRSNNGIGPYIAKYFHENQAQVAAVLGTTKESAEKAAENLSRFGISANGYTDFDLMVKTRKPDAVAIASPMETHYKYILASINAGMHVFCEKPFIWDRKNHQDTIGRLDNIFEIAENRGLTIAMNCQWIFSLPFYESLCGPVEKNKAKTFKMHLSPSSPDSDTIADSMPHVLSILFKSLGDGKIKDLKIEGNESKTTICFDYKHLAGICRITTELVPSPDQPRKFAYGFDGKMVFRKIDMKTYDIFFCHDKKIIRIKDPLELSVYDFIKAVENKRTPLAGRTHIYHNMNLLQKMKNKT